MAGGGERLTRGRLYAMAPRGLTVGIGFVKGDTRRPEVMTRARQFCTPRAYSDAATMLGDLESGRVDAAVRGSLPSAPFLARVRAGRPGGEVVRVALLSLAGGRPLLLCPVGIDEGGTVKSMERLVRRCREFCALLGWEPRVAVLSAGRLEDACRGARIAQSLERGRRLAELDGVRHFQISIEEAVRWGNCVIAPDGVSGNLLYRALVHLGGASSHGALYFPLSLCLGESSRGGTADEYVGAMSLAAIAAGRRPSRGAG